MNLSVNSSFQQILVIWTLLINLKALNTIGRHVPNVLVEIAFQSTRGTHGRIHPVKMILKSVCLVVDFYLDFKKDTSRF